jgi:hypothetical protein
MWRSLTVTFALVALTGCVEKRERPRLVFDTGTLKKAQWSQVDKTCEYEAAKAIVPIKIGIIATEQYRKLYVLCAESKGAEFIGSTDKVTTSGPTIVEVQPYYYN